ncbi:hypothetical protein H2204_003979 [Knufia peltigerae]|uniref:DUF521 domain protein n=1 Tax=Knufia peltigerae TaxID=1002370 RepID=A0AA38Y862_9EURO|nr:hypothetical protein H2204_003979 [Knufia peltigerae]
MRATILGRSLVRGLASGELLVSNVALSCWGGVEVETGMIVDQHHPLKGECITGRILAIPCGRGSCTGSGIILELLLGNRGPAALVFQYVEEIMTLGVMVAKAIFSLSIPVIVLSETDFSSLQSGQRAIVRNTELIVGQNFAILESPSPSTMLPRVVKLSNKDERMFSGACGAAVRLAMEILVDVAEMQGAEALLDVSQAHIDACIYVGPASLEFAERFLSLGARFAVPTTLNSISIDQRRWRELGMDPTLGREAEKLSQTYMSMGAIMSFTCAPYMLETAPKRGENIGWAESNAVVFANSVLGARTQKYPDFLDVCIALTGRAPAAGCHLEHYRLPTIEIKVGEFFDVDDTFYPLLGYHVGTLSGPNIPVIRGLEHLGPSISQSDLKAFGAAFATTSSAPMFHIQGVTPEASNDMCKRRTEDDRLPCYEVGRDELRDCWRQLNTATTSAVTLVSLGNPHFALDEFATLAKLCAGRRKHADVQVIITTSRAVQQQASRAGHLDVIVEEFGAKLVTDTCWCMLGEPVVPVDAENIMTNSGKYAHYAPGMLRRGVHFASLSRCVDAACKGEVKSGLPEWLADPPLVLNYAD